VASESCRTVPAAQEHLGEGRYTLLQRIGRGGAGTVYRARDNASVYPRIVCIKRLLGTLASDNAPSLLDEARLLTTVRHANVVSLLAVGEEPGGLPFLVLELIDGMDLRAMCRALSPVGDWPGLLPDLIAVHVGCAVLRALAAVQRAIPGLVHRDVTPHNILVSSEGEIKLADFGIAVAMERRVTPLAQGSWEVKGKLGYMAPEQVRGEELDVRADLFAVGVLVYELLARVRPCSPMQGMDEVRALERGDVVPLHLHRPKLDRELLLVTSRLLAPRREDRFSSADDALRALAPFSAGEMGSLRLAALVRRSMEAGSGGDEERPSGRLITRRTASASHTTPPSPTPLTPTTRSSGVR
jgi:serine/threonine-protein kinase